MLMHWRSKVGVGKVTTMARVMGWGLLPDMSEWNPIPSFVMGLEKPTWGVLLLPTCPSAVAKPSDRLVLPAGIGLT